MPATEPDGVDDEPIGVTESRHCRDPSVGQK